MKCIYFYVDSSKRPQLGVEKKIRGQIQAFNKNGIETDLFVYKRDKFINKFLERLPCTRFYTKRLFKELESMDLTKYSAIYLRKHAIDKSFVKLLKRIKQVNNKIELILELPTYPYDLELKKISQFPPLIKDRIYRRQLNKLIDRIVTFSDDTMIFGIKTICIDNGIESDFTKREENKYDGKTINLLAVASMQKWHGLDRILKGIDIYYKNNDRKYEIIINIVGDGPEKINLENLAKQLNINKYVKFHGMKQGSELKDLYADADIGIGSLGMYRINLQYGKTLKLREYCSMSLPFIKGYFDNVFDENNFEMMLTVPNDDSSINLNMIVDFYEELKTKKNSVNDYMNKFTQEKLSWDIQLLPVIDFIKGKENITY